MRNRFPKKWIKDYKFCLGKLADKVLEPYLKQTDPNIPPVITIPPGLSKEEFLDIAYTKHIAPVFNDWRHKLQSAMKNIYLSK